MPASDFEGISALVRTIAKALNMPEAEVAAAFEADRVAVAFLVGESGQRQIEVAIGERRARIAAGAIES
jgi:hypothetical protein